MTEGAEAEEPTDEQKTWVKKQMGSVDIVKSKNGNGRKTEEIVHKYSSKNHGPLREAANIGGIPYFLKMSYNEKRNDYFITVDPKIEEATKVLRPPLPKSVLTPHMNSKRRTSPPDIYRGH